MESGGTVQFWYDVGVMLMMHMTGGNSSERVSHRARPAPWHPPLTLPPAQDAVT